MSSKSVRGKCVWNGLVTLVAGTATVANLNKNVSASCIASVVCKEALGTTGNAYEIDCGDKQFTVSAISTAGAVVNTDTSVLHVCLFQQF